MLTFMALVVVDGEEHTVNIEAWGMAEAIDIAIIELEERGLEFNRNALEVFPN